MADFFRNVLTASFHGSILILAVLVLRLILRKTPKKFICYLWMLAGLRLLIPIPLQSSFSLQPPSISIPIPTRLSGILGIFWIVVAAIIASYSLLSYLHLRRQVADAVKVPGGWESDKIETAFVLGFVKPKIYIPAGMSGQARQQILAHERTHLDKGDHWIKVIGFLALALHWFNPLVWVSYILLCKDMEMACDERVVQFMELEERKAYATALLQCSTNQVHYAACPVAFGEVSVKYRIKSALHYKKPGFWISLLGVLAIVFAAVCLFTSPTETVEVPVDSQKPLMESSHQDPADFTPAQAPTLDPNPDWGVTVYMDASSTTGGTLVYAVEERFAAASDTITMENGLLDRWNGSQWEPMPTLSGKAALFERHSIGFAQSRDYPVAYFEEEVNWSLYYGALPAGDYRITQTISSDTDSAVFQTAFHIYREQLPTEEEAALERCTKALDTLYKSSSYSVVLSETNPAGGVSPVQRITKDGIRARTDFYLGEYCTSSYREDDNAYITQGWQTPFRLDQNRQFLFPEEQSVIGQEEITFCSVWADYQGIAYRGKDTFGFFADGTLKSIERLVETVDGTGNVTARDVIRLDAENPLEFSSFEHIMELGSYEVEDTFTAQSNSPWGVFFRVDDDLLTPSSGEVWLGTDAVGVSNYTTDGTYWLEKKMGSRWQRLGGEKEEASWGEDTIRLQSRTTVFTIDWTDTYGRLDAGVYRMGKHFYNGSESIIQYAEFAIYPTGGIFGEGGEDAIARVDGAIARLQAGNYRVEKHTSSVWDYCPDTQMTEVIWKYGDTMVEDFYNKAGSYSHSWVGHPGDSLYGTWFKRSWSSGDYDCIYFAEGYSVISDREIRFAQSYSQTSSDNPVTLYTYRFDENGNLTDILYERCGGLWNGFVTHYVITDTPESEIKAWVEEQQAQQ